MPMLYVLLPIAVTIALIHDKKGHQEKYDCPPHFFTQPKEAQRMHRQEKIVQL
jgi:hypothetical protein